MSRDHVLTETRQRIHDYLATHPGSHLREVARSLEMPLGTALYHLDHLCARDVLVVRRDGRYKRYFHAQGLGRAEKDLVSALHHDVPRRLALALLPAGALSQRELAERVRVSRSTLSFHVTNLVQKGLLVRHGGWPEGRYDLADRDAVTRVLGAYGAGLARRDEDDVAGAGRT